jgi:hypothetical protein
MRITADTAAEATTVRDVAEEALVLRRFLFQF